MKSTIIAIGVTTLGFVMFLLWSQPSQDPVIDESQFAHEDQQSDTAPDASVVTSELQRLPSEVEVSGRSVTIDSQTVPDADRLEYAQLPYEITIGDEVRLVETSVVLEQGESPIDFIARFVQTLLPSEEELQAYPDTMYTVTASLHRMDNELVEQYPAADEVSQAQEGLTGVVRVMNFPDDSIGGREHRFDFVTGSDGAWVFVWHGERVFCRRPDNEFWQPADRLCP